MAFLHGITFTGKIGDFTAYRMRGCKNIVLRQRGGPTREQIKHGSNFVNLRRNMSEFGGCSRMGKHVRLALHPLKALSDTNFSGEINAIMKVIQKQDETSAWGRRAIRLSEHPRLLEGFPLNDDAPTFDSVVRNPVHYTLNRETRSARIDIPELMRGVNFFPNNNHAMFSIVVTLGIAPDFSFNPGSGEYEAPAWYGKEYMAREVSSAWYPALEGSPATTLDIALDTLPPDESWSLVLSIGVCYGAFRESGEIRQVKLAGAANILALRGKDDPMNDAPDDRGNGSDGEVMPEPVERMQREENIEVAPIEKPEAKQKLSYVYTVKQEEKAEERVKAVFTYTVPVKDLQQEGYWEGTETVTGSSVACETGGERHLDLRWCKSSDLREMGVSVISYNNGRHDRWIRQSETAASWSKSHAARYDLNQFYTLTCSKNIIF